MPTSYAVVLRRSAVITAPVALAMAAVSLVVGGGKGLLGAVLGVALVTAFFGISAAAVALASRRSQQAVMVTAIVTYLAKIVILLFLVARFAGTTAFNGKLFGFTAIACVLAWSGAQAVTTMRLKVPYVEPDPPSALASGAETGGRPLTVPDTGPDGER